MSLRGAESGAQKTKFFFQTQQLILFFVVVFFVVVFYFCFQDVYISAQKHHEKWHEWEFQFSLSWFRFQTDKRKIIKYYYQKKFKTTSNKCVKKYNTSCNKLKNQNLDLFGFFGENIKKPKNQIFCTPELNALLVEIKMTFQIVGASQNKSSGTLQGSLCHWEELNAILILNVISKRSCKQKRSSWI